MALNAVAKGEDSGTGRPPCGLVGNKITVGPNSSFGSVNPSHSDMPQEASSLKEAVVNNLHNEEDETSTGASEASWGCLTREGVFSYFS